MLEVRFHTLSQRFQHVKSVSVIFVSNFVIGYGHPVCFDLTTSGSQLLNHLHKYLKKFMVFLYKIINIIFSLLYFTPLQAKTVVKYITITFTCESVYKLLT